MTLKKKITGLVMPLEDALKTFKREKPKPENESFRLTVTAEQKHINTIKTASEEAFLEGCILRFAHTNPTKVTELFNDILKKSVQVYNEYIQKQQKQKAEALASLKEQSDPMYRLALCATFGFGGSTEGTRGKSKTGQNLFRECRAYPKETWLKFIENLRNGNLPHPLKAYDPEFINDAIQWATNVIATMN